MARNYPRSKPAERFIYVLFLFIVFVLSVGALGKGWYEHPTFQTKGLITEGVIIARDTTVKGDQQITYQIEVTASDGTVHTYQNTRFVMRGSITLPGELIQVIYLPTRPELSNVVGNRYLLIGDIAWAMVIFGAIETFVGVLLVLHVKEWRQKLATQSVSR